MKLILAFILCWSVGACELLVKARDHSNPDPEEDRRGCYKRGMVVVIKPDGHPWGAEEGLPRFALLKLPGVSVDRAIKYIAQQFQGAEVYRRRLWQIRWADLPLAARNKLAASGELVIRVGSYAGPADYTWDQVKTYFRNLETGLDETGGI